jgi:RNA polymerase-associated protein RTF1
MSYIPPQSDISAMLQRRNQVQNIKPTGMSTLERSRLTQARTLAMRRHDYDEMKDIDTQLAAAENLPAPARVEAVDVLAKVNERNRKANQEAVRRAEMAESERKRRERKLVAAGGTTTPQDPSARLKTVPRLFNAATPTSRFVPSLFSSFYYVVVLATRALGSAFLCQIFSCCFSPLRPGTPLANGTTGTVTPQPPVAKTTVPTKSFEASMLDSIEIDLGDF